MGSRLPPSFSLPMAIVGAGVTGQALARLFQTLGCTDASYTLFDSAPGRGRYSDPDEMIAKFKPRTLVVSPGVPLSTPWIREFEKSGGQVLSELSVCWEFLEGERVLGVTGSLGKSTTVSLLEAGLKRFSRPSFVGGNLGIPLAQYLAERVSGQRIQAPWLVLELSSFQLEKAPEFLFEHSAITYLTPNHLERYANLEDYYETKWKLVRQTRGSTVLNARGGDLKDFAASHTNPRLVWADRQNTSLKPVDFLKAKLVGAHNRDNIAVAAALAQLCEWPPSALEGMLSFTGLPHRVQNLGHFGGVRFVNDSKATAIESVLTATRSLCEESSEGSLWLLLGGRDKKLPWEQLQSLSQQRGLHFVYFGECRKLAKAGTGVDGPEFPTLESAVAGLKSLCSEGDTVLLSPGGSSLDEFKNFEDRGQHFEAFAKHNFGVLQ